MEAYQQILVSTDFSEFSGEVAKKAIHLAGHFNAAITLLHVAERLPENSDSDDVVIDKNRHQLDEFARSIPNFKMIPIVSLSETNVEDEIISVAKQIKANLIVIGAQGDNGVSVLPSLNTKSFKEKAPCDVLVVHAETV